MSDAPDLSSLLDDIAPPAILPEAVKAQGNKDMDGLKWARDCAWVWEHLGERPTLKAAGEGGRFELWKFAKKDPAAFIAVMSKASVALDRAMSKTPNDDFIHAEEKKSIHELQVWWRQIIRDSAAADV